MQRSRGSIAAAWPRRWRHGWPAPPCAHGQGRSYQAGLVESLAHPRGQVTGISNLADRLVPKRIELLKETAPSATRIAVARCSRCKHTSGQSEVDIEAMLRDEAAAARSLGVAKALGVAIPQRALLRADAVIE